ncbi:MAG: polyprenol monophosphomannose synthase [Candidatus Sumerlaeaceae bacterium]|nr:polyprenol monophosphomannose synthase [Candidatus Sumerlaeaceae bacterium]
MRIVVTLPTYNEAENIAPLIEQILALGDEFEVLVIDDDSPDRTWEIVMRLSKSEPRVQLIRRIGERGRGTAGLVGFKWAREEGADVVVEMDADFSHQPKFIPSLLEPIRSGEADIVIGSRLVGGGGETGRSPLRTLITLFANSYIRFVLGLPIRDCTSGFRVFNRRALESLPWEHMRCQGPEIVQEVLHEARKLGLKIVERPIIFEERRAGQSTFNLKIMLRSFLYMIRLRFR